MASPRPLLARGFFSLYQNLISTTFGCNIIGDYLPEVTGCGGYLPNGDGAGLLGRRRVRVGEHVTAAVTAAATELGTYDDKRYSSAWLFNNVLFTGAAFKKLKLLAQAQYLRRFRKFFASLLT